MSNRRIERIPDDHLATQLNAVRAHIRRTRKHGGNTMDAEVVLCYLEREQELREKRQQAHVVWIEAEDVKKAKAAREEEEAIKAFLATGQEQGLDG